MTAHTPGPWTYSGDEMEPYPIRNAEGRAVRTSERANAARIVACVNACEGVPTNDLYETMLVDRCNDVQTMLAERDRLAALNARLTEALTEARKDLQTLAEQSSRVPGSTNRVDCMAAMAAVGARNIDAALAAAAGEVVP